MRCCGGPRSRHEPGDRRLVDRDDVKRGRLPRVEPAVGRVPGSGRSHRVPALRTDREPRARRPLAPRHVAGGGIDRRDRQGRGRHAAPQHRIRGARHRGRQERNGQAAAGDPQLGRPARDGAGRAERSLHRTGRRHLGGPHRRRQRARQSQPAEQLPARRRGQQQLLDQRAGAHHAAVASVGRRDRGVQGRHEPLRRRIRLVTRRGHHRQHQVRHESLPRHGLRLLPRRFAWTPSTTSPRPPTSRRRPTSRTSSAATSAGR